MSAFSYAFNEAGTAYPQTPQLFLFIGNSISIRFAQETRVSISASAILKPSGATAEAEVSVCWGLEPTGVGSTYPMTDNNGEPVTQPVSLTGPTPVTFSGLVAPGFEGDLWVGPCVKSDQPFVLSYLSGFMVLAP